jgi:hypothetical protein
MIKTPGRKGVFLGNKIPDLFDKLIIDFEG